MSGPASDATTERSRRRVLRDGLVGAIAVGSALGARKVASAGAAAAGSSLPPQDAKILNFLLELERLQVTFFERAGRDSRFNAELRQFATVTARQDKAHLATLRSLLGASVEAPTAQLQADPHDDAEFARDALALKEAAVAAYIGEAPNLESGRVTTVAGIASVEARHAAWIRSIHTLIPAPRAADRAQPPATVARALEGSGIASIH
jgi:Ferritin-like domain